MQNLLKFNLTIITLVILLVSSSCSSDDDDSPTISPPTINLNLSEVDVLFYAAGSTTAFTTDWNGAQGTFSILGSVDGLSINSMTGELSWSNQLPLGVHDVTVVATNSAGSSQQIITLNNPLQGSFTGTYGGFNYYQFEFNPDGTVIVGANDADNPEIATGTWTRNESEVVVDYTYSDDSEYSTRGSLYIGNSDVIYSGYWYYSHGATEGNQGSEFELEME